MNRYVISTVFILSAFFNPLVFTASADDPETKSDSGKESYTEMVIKNIVFDQNTQAPIVLLSDNKDTKLIPIWIGLCEARSIGIGVSKAVTPRPMTYDLIAAVIRTLGAEVERIVVVDIRDQIYYAQVELSVNGKISKIDARPSDAIALASRMNAPIYVKNSVLDKAALSDPSIEEREL